MPKIVLDVKLYSTVEVAELLGITPQTARTYVTEGKIKGKKIGGKYYVSEEKLLAFLKGSE